MADKSLLERLNALKPSSISTRPTASVADRPPASREDDLASRLKTLRLAREEDEGKHPSASEDAKATAEAAAEAAAEVEAEDDDAAVDDLLMEIAAEHGLGDEDAEEAELGSNDLVPLPDVPSSDWLQTADVDGHSQDDSADDSGDEQHSRQVEELLQQLAGTPIKGGQISDKQRGGDGKGDADSNSDADADADADDSDGDIMQAEIRRVLDRAKDEAALESGTERPQAQADGSGEPREEDPLGLPAVPTTFADDADGLCLPSVPTQDLPERGGDDDISQRLAALRGLRGKAAGLGQTDAFGLPSAPTFKPGDEGGVLKRGHFGFGRVNYSDEDQQKWCIVCLEDATIRCVGCAENGAGASSANNTYCEGCWRDMHVGPAAGFDERGHMRVPLKKVQWP